MIYDKKIYSIYQNFKMSQGRNRIDLEYLLLRDYIVVIDFFQMGHNGSRVIQIKNV